MLIIDLTYKKSLDEVNQYLEPHRAFLNKGYEQSVFLASGPKNPRTGGVILALGERAEIEDFIKQDPFYEQGIADYQLTEFSPVKHCEALAPLLGAH